MSLSNFPAKEQVDDWSRRPPPRRSRDGIQRPPKPYTVHLHRIDNINGHSFHIISSDRQLTLNLITEADTILDSHTAPTFAQAHDELKARYPELKFREIFGECQPSRIK